MANNSLKKDTFNGVIWRVVEAGGSQMIHFLVSIVLARLIAPEQFAAIALLAIFTSLATAFINSGFSTALIRKVNRTQLDCCTVYYFNIGVSIISYIVLFFIAPFVSDFYSLPILTPLLRVTSLGIVIGSFAGVHRTLFQAEMKFKELAKYQLSAIVISGTIGIIMAYYDFQVWALVAQSLSYTLVGSIIISYKSYWRPSFQFSFKSLKEFFAFGSKLLGSTLLGVLYDNMYAVVIGKFFVKADLAFYNRAQAMKTITSTLPTNVLQSVTYPALCKLQGNDDQLRSGYRKMIQVSSFVIFPICLGVGAVSYPLINVLYTETWIFSATLLQIIVFAGMLYPIHAINLNLLTVKGRTDLFFKLDVLKKCVAVAIMFASIPFGLVAMCCGSVLSSIIALFINTYYTGKLLKFGIREQFKDMLPSLSLALTMFAVCKYLSTLLGEGFVSLIISILVGIIIYAGGAWLFKFKELELLKNIRK